jgi:ATP phosphoribosyltransferase
MSRLLSLQSNALDALMSETVATRLLVSSERVSDPKKALTLTELYGTLQASVWRELSTGVDIVSTRRNLQREHLKRITATLLRPASGTAADVRSIQREQANKLLTSIRSAMAKPSLSAEAKAHLSESLSTLTEVLKASVTRSGV